MRPLGGGTVDVALRMGRLNDPNMAANIPDLLCMDTKPLTIFFTRGLQGTLTWG